MRKDTQGQLTCRDITDHLEELDQQLRRFDEEIGGLAADLNAPTEFLKELHEQEVPLRLQTEAAGALHRLRNFLSDERTRLAIHLAEIRRILTTAEQRRQHYGAA